MFHYKAVSKHPRVVAKLEDSLPRDMFIGC